ncbi:MAG: pyridoxal phosphate-dependent aminotransferase [Nitrospirota bacterium]
MTSSHTLKEKRNVHAPGSCEEENCYRIAEEMNMHERKIIDFSFPVNPLGVSKRIRAELRRRLKDLNRYPDSDAKRLKKRLSQYHDIDPEKILCGNGSSELLSLFVRELKPLKVLIPAPAHQGFAQTVSRIREIEEGESAAVEYYEMGKEYGFRIDALSYIQALERMATSSPDMPHFCMAFLCNPNSISGRLIGRGDVRRIAEAAKAHRCYLILDEAFLDFCAGESLLAEGAENPYLIILRTMTYVYALAGLRIGYGVCAGDLAQKIERHREPWTINSLAQKAAAVALKDRAYLNETYTVVRSEKKFLEKSFLKLDMEFFPSDANFYLVKIQNANEVYEELKQKGILLGACSGFRGLDNTYLRIAVKSHRENAALVRELSKLLKKKG